MIQRAYKAALKKQPVITEKAENHFTRTRDDGNKLQNIDKSLRLLKDDKTPKLKKMKNVKSKRMKVIDVSQEEL
ncbi:MAG: hypothetical protein AAF404_07010, partial [Pseudomonadota bacterium]